MKYLTDSEIVDSIATDLADAEDWSDPASFLEEFARLIATTHRPHPGNHIPSDDGSYSRRLETEGYYAWMEWAEKVERSLMAPMGPSRAELAHHAWKGGMEAEDFAAYLTKIANGA